MSVEENKAAIRKLMQGFWDGGDPGVMDQVFSPNFVNQTPAPGVPPTFQGLKQTNIMIRSAFSDHRSTVEDLVAEGDTIAWRWTFAGKHTGEIMGIPPTGKYVTMSGIVFDRFEGGRIVERWDQADALTLMQQLGVIPTPG